MDYLIIKDLLRQKFNDDIGSLIFEYIPKPRHIMCDIVEAYKTFNISELEEEYFEEDECPFVVYCHLELGILDREWFLYDTID
jgi:hypothetical protein